MTQPQIEEAHYFLGELHVGSMEVFRNYEEAMKWFRLAASQGHVGAQFSLGVIYLNGRVAPVNNIKAYMWIFLAITQGYPNAQSDVILLNTLMVEMTGQQIAEAEQLTANCLANNYKNCD